MGERWSSAHLAGVSWTGRPAVWTVLEHPSSRVAYDVYKGVLKKVVERLPFQCRVVFTAARGFADTHLMHHLTALGWHWRIRSNGSFWVYRHGKPRCTVHRMPWSAGQALFWHQVDRTKPCDGPVHLALGRPQDRQEYWFVVSDEPTESKTCEEYGLRFDIEENCSDDQSNGFQLESTLLRSAKALERLCCVRAITTLYLVAQGAEVVTQDKRRWVDAHWFRGRALGKSVGVGGKLALSRGYELITSVHLPAEADPSPAMASKTQPQKHLQRVPDAGIPGDCCRVIVESFVSQPDYVDCHYNHSDGTYPLAHHPVTSLYVSGPVRFPWGLRLYRRYED